VVVEDRVDVAQVDEVLDVDRARLLRIERVELVRRDHHVALLRELVALDDVVEGDFLIGVGIDPLLRDPVAGLAVELVEAHGLAADRGVQLDGHVDEPERDRAAPD
jgi:hypothetical protein